ncbi:MAG: peptidylprolyl isomerase [Planctomycetota bacterium]|nr:peptidylprolyl isomerase [Planctomycetota bacterium]
MADHKAPPQVTIAPYEEASQLQQMVDTYWKPFLGVAVVLAALIVWQQSSQHAAEKELDASWDSLSARVELAGIGSTTQLPSAAVLDQALASDGVKGTVAAPWAMALKVQTLLEGKDWDGAEAALAALESAYPDHFLVKAKLPVGSDGALATIPEQQRALISSRRQFESTHVNLFELPPVPEGATRVKLETSSGDLVVALYADRAPLHVGNFLKLVSSGFYDGTKFHRVVPGFMVQGGDPNTKIGDASTWGQGGPDYKVQPEISDLFHFKGVLAAAKMPGETDSSGSQFYVTTGNAHHLDGQHTVFGVLEEGADVLRIIENSPVVPGTERPEEPTTLVKATVL